MKVFGIINFCEGYIFAKYVHAKFNTVGNKAPYSTYFLRAPSQPVQQLIFLRALLQHVLISHIFGNTISDYMQTCLIGLKIRKFGGKQKRMFLVSYYCGSGFRYSRDAVVFKNCSCLVVSSNKKLSSVDSIRL